MKDESCIQVMILSDGDLSACPDRIKIIPTGHIDSEQGDFYVDEESFRLMKSEMARRGIDIVIDYEHQTLKDVQAPAGGWIKELFYTPEAIVAKVEWTKKAAEYLKSKEYRYLSPVIACRKNDKKAVRLHSLALTNTPAINGMFAIANKAGGAACIGTAKKEAATGGQKMEMDMNKLIGLLGLPADATQEQVSAALEEKLKKPDEKAEPKTDQEKKPEDEEMVANSVILGLLGLDDTAKTEDAAGKIMELKAGSTDTVKRLNELYKRMEEKEADEAVRMALKAGKITADQKEWARSYALKDKKGFDGFIEKAPVVVPFAKIQAADAPRRDRNDVSTMVLKATGMTKEDIMKYADREENE